MLNMNIEIDSAKIRMTPDGRVTREDAATFLGLKKKSLSEWHRLGKGPRTIKIGGRAFYALADLQAFVAAATLEAS